MANNTWLGNNGVNTTGQPDNKNYNDYATNNQALQEANTVRDNRLNQGLDVSQQDAWIKQLQGNRNNYEYWMGGAYQSAYDGLNASALADKQSSIHEIEKAYQQAVYEGQLSMREAEDLYKADLAKLDAGALEQKAQAAHDMGSRGIQDSMMGLGVEQGINNRRDNQYRDRRYSYDKQILNLKDRMRMLEANKGLDLANINAQFDLAKQGNMAKVAGEYMGSMGKFKYDDYSANRDKEWRDEEFDREWLKREEQALRERGWAKEDIQTKMDFEREMAKMEFNNAKALQAMASRGGGRGGSGDPYANMSDWEKVLYDRDMARSLEAYDALENKKIRNMTNSPASANIDFMISGGMLGKYGAGARVDALLGGRADMANGAVSRFNSKYGSNNPLIGGGR